MPLNSRSSISFDFYQFFMNGWRLLANDYLCNNLATAKQHTYTCTGMFKIHYTCYKVKNELVISTDIQANPHA